LGLTFVLAACGSTASNAAKSTSSSTTVAPPATESALSFREVLGEMPYRLSSTSAGTSAGPSASSSCPGGRLVTPRAKQTPERRIFLTDRQKSVCYALGPALLTATDASADAASDPTTSDWVVNVHFTRDDFVREVASVEVGKQIAIIVDGVVESAPTINAGITGQDVTISGTYDEATARRVAARIDPSSVSRMPETPTTTATDALMQTFSKRCDAVGPRLGFGRSMSGVTMFPVDAVRSGFERAHEPVPSELATLDGRQQIAGCYFTTENPLRHTSPTTICPNGDHADVDPAPPDVMFVVDGSLKAFRFPGIQYLVPTGMTVPPTPGPCVGLGSR
jgi:hypothetical protein